MKTSKTVESRRFAREWIISILFFTASHCCQAETSDPMQTSLSPAYPDANTDRANMLAMLLRVARPVFISQARGTLRADLPSHPLEIMDNYPSFGPSIGQVPEGKTVADVQRALSYYNPVIFAPLIKCPAYVGSKIGDVTLQSLGPLAAYHNLTGLAPENKAFYPGFTHFHGSGPGLGVKAKEVLESLAGPLSPKEEPSE